MSENSSQPDFSEVTVLIVDDDEAVRDSLCGFLTDGGWQIQTADSAETALEIVRSGVGDIVVTDVRMPGMDGIEAMGRILSEHNTLPVILNTAYSSYKDNFLSWSADAYVIKSSDLKELKAAIKKLLEKSEADEA